MCCIENCIFPMTSDFGSSSSWKEKVRGSGWRSRSGRRATGILQNSSSRRNIDSGEVATRVVEERVVSILMPRDFHEYRQECLHVTDHLAVCVSLELLSLSGF